MSLPVLFAILYFVSVIIAFVITTIYTTERYECGPPMRGVNKELKPFSVVSYYETWVVFVMALFWPAVLFWTIIRGLHSFIIDML